MHIPIDFNDASSWSLDGCSGQFTILASPRWLPMTREDDAPTVVRKIVVVFDICSSTSVLEDLNSTDNLPRWRNLLIGLKTFLIEQSGHLNF
jgi:hypothetical protein